MRITSMGITLASLLRTHWMILRIRGAEEVAAVVEIIVVLKLWEMEIPRPSGERRDDWPRALILWTGVGMRMQIFVLGQW